MDEIIKEVSCLTKRQREVFELREQGLTYKAIADQLGINVSGARQHYINAERRFREYTRYHKIAEQNLEIAPIELTRGEVKVIAEALRVLERDMMKTAVFNVNSAWQDRLPYEAKIVVDIYKKAHTVIYGEPPSKTLLFAGAFDEATDESKTKEDEARDCTDSI